MRRKRLVYFEWFDSGGEKGWTRKADFAHRVFVCKSVGWILKEDAKSISVASHIADDEGRNEQYDGMMTVPKCAIRKRKIIG